MLVVSIQNGATLLHWHVGYKLDMLAKHMVRNADKPLLVQADGDEKEWVVRTFPFLECTAKVAFYPDPFARLIVSNLPAL